MSPDPQCPVRLKRLLLTVGIDVGGDLGRQRRREHLPSAVTGKLVEQ